MNIKNWLKARLNPYSPEGLRERASLLPNVPYKVLLELTAIQLEKKAISEDIARKAVEYFRTGKRELLMVGVKMLHLQHEQIQEVLTLLKTGTIKDYTDR